MNEDILNQLGQPSEEPTEEVKVIEPKKKSNIPLDDEVIASMLANGDNTKGLFQPDESEIVDNEKDEKLHEDPDKDVKLKTKGNAKPSEKYAAKFQEDMKKNPEDYYIDTPKGRMTVKEAKEQGYDPLTRRFNLKEKGRRGIENVLKDLNPKDQEGFLNMINPKNVGLAPADAQAMGLKPDSKMIRQANPMEGTQMSSPSPAQVATPMSAPAAGSTPTQGAPDINALLGGNV